MKKVMGSIIFEEDELPKEIAISQKAKQLYNKTYGDLTVLYPYEKTKEGKIRWLCRCKCGKYCGVVSSRLSDNGGTKSCGCLRIKTIRERYAKIFPDQQIASLKIISRNEGTDLWNVQCLKCKREYQVSNKYLLHLINNNIKENSCGCETNKLISQRKIIDLKNKKIGYLTVKKFVGITNNNANWLCECECGKEIVYSSVQLRHENKISCGCKSKMSKYAYLTYEALCKLNLNFSTEYIFSDLKSEKNSYLRFDFAIFNNKQELIGLIEVQGQQHYKPTNKFGGEEEFIVRQKNDNLKRDYCVVNNIPLLELPYFIFHKKDNKEIEERIDTWLRELQMNKKEK